MGMLANRLDKSYRIQWFHHTRSFPGVTQLGIFLRDTLFRFLKFFVKRFSLRSKLICSKNLSQNDLVHSHHTISHFLRSPKTVSLTASLSLSWRTHFRLQTEFHKFLSRDERSKQGKTFSPPYATTLSLSLSLSFTHTHPDIDALSLSFLAVSENFSLVFLRVKFSSVQSQLNRIMRSNWSEGQFVVRNIF